MGKHDEELYNALSIITTIVELHNNKSVAEIAAQMGLEEQTVEYILTFSKDVFRIYRLTGQVCLGLTPSGGLDVSKETFENYAIAKRQLVREVMLRDGKISKALAENIFGIAKETISDEMGLIRFRNKLLLQLSLSCKDDIASLVNINSMLRTTQVYLKSFVDLQERQIAIERVRMFIDKVLGLIREQDIGLAEKIRQALADDSLAIIS